MSAGVASGRDHDNIGWTSRMRTRSHSRRRLIPPELNMAVR